MSQRFVASAAVLLGLALSPAARGQGEPPADEPPAAEPGPPSEDEAPPEVEKEPDPEQGADPPEREPPSEPEKEAEPEKPPEPEPPPPAPQEATPEAPPAEAEEEEQEDTEEPEEQEEEEEIVVTGSHLKRQGFQTPTAVLVLQREEIASSGYSNIGDLLRHLTINSGSETQPGLGVGSIGSSQFNLRGLGLNTTLVLLNGRRLVTFPYVASDGSVFVDVNQIPLEFVERIEVAKGGASAIYGSDAVAGVVNIITRKHFDGAAISVMGQATDTWDQTGRRVFSNRRSTQREELGRCAIQLLQALPVGV